MMNMTSAGVKALDESVAAASHVDLMKGNQMHETLKVYREEKYREYCSSWKRNMRCFHFCKYACSIFDVIEGVKDNA